MRTLILAASLLCPACGSNFVGNRVTLHSRENEGVVGAFDLVNQKIVDARDKADIFLIVRTLLTVTATQDGTVCERDGSFSTALEVPSQTQDCQWINGFSSGAALVRDRKGALHRLLIIESTRHMPSSNLSGTTVLEVAAVK